MHTKGRTKWSIDWHCQSNRFIFTEKHIITNKTLIFWVGDNNSKKKEIRYVPFAIQREKVLVCISASTMQWQYLPTLSRLDEREFVSVLWVLGLGTAGDFGNKSGMGFSLGGWTLFSLGRAPTITKKRERKFFKEKKEKRDRKRLTFEARRRRAIRSAWSCAAFPRQLRRKWTGRLKVERAKASVTWNWPPAKTIYFVYVL